MNNLSIVMYHYVRDLKKSRYPKIKGLDLNLFRQQIEFLKQNFNIISIENVIDSIDRNIKLPDNSIVLSFDDGYIDHYVNVFPILMENRIEGFFSMPAKILNEKKLLDVNKIHFILASSSISKLIMSIFKKLNYYRGSEFNIPSNDELYKSLAVANRFDNKDVIFLKRLLQVELPERLRGIITNELFKEYISLNEETFVNELYMSYDQVKFMKKMGMNFGIHGYDHYWLEKLPKKDMKNDIKKALDFFKDIVNHKNWVMCYPYGSYNNDVIQYIRENGCKLGLTTNVGVSIVNEENRYKLFRLDTNDYPPKSNVYLNR